jgi:hypothetical protein
VPTINSVIAKMIAEMYKSPAAASSQVTQ